MRPCPSRLLESLGCSHWAGNLKIETWKWDEKRNAKEEILLWRPICVFFAVKSTFPLLSLLTKASNNLTCKIHKLSALLYTVEFNTYEPRKEKPLPSNFPDDRISNCLLSKGRWGRHLVTLKDTSVTSFQNKCQMVLVFNLEETADFSTTVKKVCDMSLQCWQHPGWNPLLMVTAAREAGNRQTSGSSLM